ncbi:hypothetical protein [Kitasatospora sp. NPDC098663]|uniref:hypothetical protein n=1 Tax=Kitasatospora sp. NPDC098663 TaxID=3364096 RepID=UPI00382AF560
MKAVKAVRRMAVGVAATALALTGTMLGAGTAQAAYDPVTHTLWNDEPLYPGWHVDSENSRLIMQPDGNLVVYRGYNTPNPLAVWNSGTHVNHCGYKAVMQSDGNLVVYSASGGVCWSSGTNGHPGARLVVKRLGGVAIYWGDGEVPIVTTPTSDVRMWAMSSDLY